MIKKTFFILILITVFLYPQFYFHNYENKTTSFSVPSYTTKTLPLKLKNITQNDEIFIELNLNFYFTHIIQPLFKKNFFGFFKECFSLHIIRGPPEFLESISNLIS